MAHKHMRMIMTNACMQGKWMHAVALQSGPGLTGTHLGCIHMHRVRAPWERRKEASSEEGTSMHLLTHRAWEAA